MLITREFGFDMGHCLPDHEGACYRPHGHRYRLEVTVDGDVFTASCAARGMVVDFGRLKSLVDEFVIGHYDHMFAMSVDDPRLHDAVNAFGDGILGCVAPPTVENIVSWIATTLADLLVDWRLELVEVTLWETPTCRATWR